MQKTHNMGTMTEKKCADHLKYGDVTKIAKAFGVSRQAVYNVINGIVQNPNASMVAEIDRINEVRKSEYEKGLLELRKIGKHEANQ
jgi:predicted regulator of amino acid metabolism with ACT domain